MSVSPTLIELPHTLGRDEARRRMQGRVGDLAKHVPGGIADVTSSWPEPYRMALGVAAMGQTVSATLDVADAVVRITLTVPPMLSFMADGIAGIIRERGTKLLTDESPASP